MLLPHFTILHWLAVIFFFVLFLAIAILATKAQGIKMTLSMIFAGFLVTSFGGVLSIIILEKYTKKATLLDVEQRRILFNETFVLKGRVKNIGRFKLNYCKLEVKLINNGFGKSITKGSFFKSGGFNIFGAKETKEKRPNTVEKNIVLFKSGLDPQISKNFSVIMKFPPYFRDASLRYKVHCH